MQLMEAKRRTRISDKVKPKHLYRLVKSEASRWRLLGFQLKVPQAQLNIIQTKGGIMSPADCFNSVILWWLDEYEGDKYWRDIYEALEDVNKARLIKDLQRKYHPDHKVELTDVDLVNLIDIAIPDWYLFGSSLNMPPEKLQTLRTPCSADICLLDMLTFWYQKFEPTWEDLIEALQHLGNKRLARKIEEEMVKYPTPVAEPTQERPWYEGIDQTELDYDEHNADVLRSIMKVNEWDQLGLALGIKSHKLDEIKQTGRYVIHDCRREMLRTWMTGGVKVTWHSLCLALADELVGHLALAKEIASKHRQQGYSAVPISTPTEATSEDGESKMLAGEVSIQYQPHGTVHEHGGNSHSLSQSSFSSDGQPPPYNPRWHGPGGSGQFTTPGSDQYTMTGPGQYNTAESDQHHSKPVPVVGDDVHSRTSHVYQESMEAENGPH